MGGVEILAEVGFRTWGVGKTHIKINHHQNLAGIELFMRFGAQWLSDFYHFPRRVSCHMLVWCGLRVCYRRVDA